MIIFPAYYNLSICRKPYAMKTNITIAALLLSLLCNAQDSSCSYTSGGFGHFFQGPSYFMPNKLVDYLESPAVLNAPISLRMGTTSGGEGAALLGSFLVGGGGFVQNSARHLTDSTRMQLSIGGGYFKFGYALVRCNHNLVYVYSGLGWGAMELRLENFSKDSGIRFDDDAAIAPGYRRQYELNLNYYDIGLSFKRIATSRKKTYGGFMFGIDLGAFITQSTSEWYTSNDEIISGPPEPRMGLNPYVRITIGGGGFSVAQDSQN